MVKVVAALIWDDDKFMICQRPAHKARALLWEFVGGKVEPGETKEQALIRECREELAVTLSVGDVFMDVVHEYPDITVHLTLFNATIREGIPQKLEHNDIQWITPAQIPNYDFCPADEEILLRIIQKAAVKKTYNKLVRDKIPEIIESDGKKCVTRALSQEEYLKELRRKLDEEVQEYHESGDHEELADILEVVYALATATGCTEDALNTIRQEKAQKRGGFSKRILLETVE